MRIQKYVYRVLFVSSVGLAICACGKVGQQSFFQFDPNNSSIDINEAGVNTGGSGGSAGSGGSSGGAGAGAAGSTSTSSASSTSTSSASSSSSTSSSSGPGNGNGNGNSASASSSSSSSSGAASSGGSGGTPPSPRPVTCNDGEVLCNVDFKCHTSASSVPASIHCVFQDQGGPLNGALPLWFSPVDEAAPGCVAVSKDSMLAKLGHLPANTGQYHFAGTLKACLKKDGSREEQRSHAILAFMANLASPPSEGRIVDRTPARKGKDFVSLDSLSGTPVSAGYCARK